MTSRARRNQNSRAKVSVYDQELLPQPDNTGLALVAMASRVERKEVQASLDFLQDRVNTLRSPRSLGWAVLALGAWGQRPVKSQDWIRESLGLQDSKRFINPTFSQAQISGTVHGVGTAI